MNADDDRLRGRLDEDQDRLIAAAAPHGFELRQPRKRPLEEHALVAFETADNVLTRLTGEVDGAKVDLFEYDWVQAGAKGAVSRGRRIALVLRHPAFEGEARCRWEQFQGFAAKMTWWSLVLVFGVLLFWLLVPIWLYQYSQGRNPFPKSWPVGNPEFEKRFQVVSSSGEQAKRALPAAMQALVVAEGTRGPIEVRPGLLALGLEGKSLDPQTFERAVRVARRVVRVYAPSTDDARTAYRVADDPADAEALEEDAEASARTNER